MPDELIAALVVDCRRGGGLLDSVDALLALYFVMSMSPRRRIGVSSCEDALVKMKSEFESERSVLLFLLAMFPVMVILGYFLDIAATGEPNWASILVLPIVLSVILWINMRQSIKHKQPRVPSVGPGDEVHEAEIAPPVRPSGVAWRRRSRRM